MAVWQHKKRKQNSNLKQILSVPPVSPSLPQQQQQQEEGEEEVKRNDTG